MLLQKGSRGSPVAPPDTYHPVSLRFRNLHGRRITEWLWLEETFETLTNTGHPPGHAVGTLTPIALPPPPRSRSQPPHGAPRGAAAPPAGSGWGAEAQPAGGAGLDRAQRRLSTGGRWSASPAGRARRRAAACAGRCLLRLQPMRLPGALGRGKGVPTALQVLLPPLCAACLCVRTCRPRVALAVHGYTWKKSGTAKRWLCFCSAGKQLKCLLASVPLRFQAGQRYTGESRLVQKRLRLGFVRKHSPSCCHNVSQGMETLKSQTCLWSIPLSESTYSRLGESASYHRLKAFINQTGSRDLQPALHSVRMNVMVDWFISGENIPNLKGRRGQHFCPCPATLTWG